MKKLIPFLAYVALTLTATPAMAQDKSSAYDRVINAGVLRCGYGISPPALVQDPNTKQIFGLDYDIWQEIGKELGVKIEFTEEAGWGNFIEGLKTGRYDAFCSQMWPDPARLKFLTLTTPVMYSFLNTYVRADDHRFDGDLEKVNNPAITIPAIEGDVSVTMAQKRFPKANILYLTQTQNASDMFMAVKTKKADVIFLDQAMYLDFAKANPDALRKLENVPASFVFPAYYGFKSGEAQLRDMVNIALRNIIDDGRMEQMAKKYSADYAAPKKNY